MLTTRIVVRSAAYDPLLQHHVDPSAKRVEPVHRRVGIVIVAVAQVEQLVVALALCGHAAQLHGRGALIVVDALRGIEDDAIVRRDARHVERGGIVGQLGVVWHDEHVLDVCGTGFHAHDGLARIAVEVVVAVGGRREPVGEDARIRALLGIVTPAAEDAAEDTGQDEDRRRDDGHDDHARDSERQHVALLARRRHAARGHDARARRRGAGSGRSGSARACGVRGRDSVGGLLAAHSARTPRRRRHLRAATPSVRIPSLHPPSGALGSFAPQNGQNFASSAFFLPHFGQNISTPLTAAERTAAIDFRAPPHAQHLAARIFPYAYSIATRRTRFTAQKINFAEYRARTVLFVRAPIYTCRNGSIEASGDAMGKRTRLLLLECTAWGNAASWRMRALAVLAAVVVACVSSLFGSAPAAFAADEMPELELRNSYQLQSMTDEYFNGLWTVSHDGTRAIISDGEQTLAVDLETGSETPLDFDQRWVSSLMPIGERDFIINSNGVLYRYGDDLEPLDGLAGSGYSVGTMCFPVADESKLRFPASRDGRVYAVVYDLEAQSVEQEIAIDSDSTGMWISNDLTRAYNVRWIDDDGGRVIIVGYDMASGKEILRNEQINPELVGSYPFFVGETDDGWPILFDIAGAHYFRIDPESGEVVPFVDRAGGTNSIPILGNELSTVVVSVGAGGSAGDNLTADDIGTAELQSIDLSTGETLYSMSTSVFARDFHGFAGYSAVTRDGRYFYQGMYDAEGGRTHLHLRPGARRLRGLRLRRRVRRDERTHQRLAAARAGRFTPHHALERATEATSSSAYTTQTSKGASWAGCSPMATPRLSSRSLPSCSRCSPV